ncbi:MAG: S-layer homology domain-containing protein [Clostridia bacterium]|nr:S-layer homology domain-containing protein [Clostridia bacterium]
MKKIISLLLTIILLVSVSTTTAFAVLGSDANIDAAKEAVKKAAKTNYATNDITMEEYLKLVRSFIPESLEVEVDYSPYGNFFQCKNATEEKDGKVKAQFRFYHKDISLNESDEYITFKIKKLEPVTSNEEVTAPVPAPAPSTSTDFADVADNAWYADAVKWAVEKGVTSGTSATTFSPDDTCTKAQILTFLWRAMGSPKHEGVSKFLDMSEADYYYHAVHWANSKNMISGPKFNANEKCTRSTTVFYLWKLAGSPRDMYSHSSQFTDLPFGSDTMRSYIGWAVAEGITSGTSETTFSPDTTCTRGQIVTFLQRAFK